jgi:small subunit ribosomal protein S17
MPRRQLQGTVVSAAMDKTAVVLVERMKAHPLYRKVIRLHKRYMAHDEGNEARPGDVVVIEECRPFSRRKRWQIVQWVERGGGS